MPGTSCGDRTTYIARLFLVPASVMSSPLPSSRTTRTASGDLLLGRGGTGRQLVAPADPAGAGEVEDQVETGRLDVEELAVPGDVVDQRALERLHRRVERLQGAERDDVDPADGMTVEPALQIEGQRFHLGQLRHHPSMPTTASSYR